MKVDLHTIMSRVHSTFPASGGREQIINVVVQLEKQCIFNGDIRRLESSIDSTLQGKHVRHLSIVSVN